MNVTVSSEQAAFDAAGWAAYPAVVESHTPNGVGIPAPWLDDLPTELHGTLGKGGLAPLVGWLADLEATGHLRLWQADWQADWTAELVLNNGQLVAATADTTHGRLALEVIVLALSEVRFLFIPGLPSPAPAPPPAALATELTQLVALYEDCPPVRPELVPRLVERADDELHGSVPVDHTTLGTWVAVDGQRSVAEIGRRLGFARAVLDLARLWQAGLLVFDAPPAAPEAAVGEPLSGPGVPQPGRPGLDTRSGPPWLPRRSWRVIVAAAVIGGVLISALALAVQLQLNPLLAPSAPPRAEIPVVASVAPGPMVTPTAEPPGRTLVDEPFVGRLAGWPNDSNGVAWFSQAGYEVMARGPDSSVAIGAPGVSLQRDVVVRARFHKVGGPPGGGYGLIVRDQSQGTRDGPNPMGNFYLIEVRDTGEVGAWQHVGQQWLDLLPWTVSSAVRPGAASNDLEASAIGTQLGFLVNGAQVFSQQLMDATPGGVGIFVGGQSNDVVLEQFAVRVPE